MVTCCSVDGTILPPREARVAVDDRGFTLGDGLFETIRAHEGRPLQLAQHLSRLQHGAALLELAAPPGEALADEIERVLAASALREAVVRLSISRGAGQRGLGPTAGAAPTVVVAVQPFEPYPERWYTQGARAIIARVRRNEWSPLCGCKSLSQGDNVLARIEARRRGADISLLLNTRGALASADCANLFVVRGERLLTPPLAAGALPGVTRAIVAAVAPEVGLRYDEAELLPDDLGSADEILLTNVLLEVAPVCDLAGYPVGAGRPGPYAALLRAAHRSARAARTAA